MLSTGSILQCSRTTFPSRVGLLLARSQTVSSLRHASTSTSHPASSSQPQMSKIPCSPKDVKLTTPNAISTLPKPSHTSGSRGGQLGDWVLFHPVYTPDEVKSVDVLHRKSSTVADTIAYRLVKLARWGYDFISGYRHKPIPEGSNLSVEELRKQGYILDDKAWLDRILFLETIAGVPGMVAATLRHLHSLRLMRRDSGWIHTLLEEAENERMHLMTFMTLKEPSIFFRALILGAQGVFYNLFFLAYLVSPRSCHRFVGYLEEEAVYTYSYCIKEIEAGRIPEWSDAPAPQIAIDYWRLEPTAKLLDVIYAVRSDETTHRFVNHSFANLNTKTDVNPFALREPDMHTKGKQIEFQREESEKYLQESHQLLKEETEKQH